MASEAGPAAPSRISLGRLLAAFVHLGTVTVGGGLQSWIHREIVGRLGWIDDETFLSGMTVARVVPGANGVNLTLYIGFRLRGALGAAVAVLGLIVPAFCVILFLGYLYRSYGHLAAVHFVLTGLAAAGVGATLTMGITVGRRLPRDLASSLTAVAVFALVGVLKLPMIPVVLALIPISIGLALLKERKPCHGS
ncbi:MAG: chromate transporter [Steroidobacteraceae bacterium]